jgi:hypothetical protein
VNMAKVFATRPPARPEPASRPEPAARRESARSESAARADNDRDESNVNSKRRASRTEFAALMALLAGSGQTVRDDLLKQLPADGVSLLDKLLAGPAEGEGTTGLLDADIADATDAIRYGLLQDRGPGHDIAAELSTLATGRSAAEHARLNEVIGRIVANRGMTVEQLKARGEERAAEYMASLDALLSQAGTPSAFDLINNAAVAAAASTLASATNASAADVTTPVRETDGLAPELKQRLTRVIDRMKQEYGHDVGIVETVRSQERQDHLYEQGRTRPGNVVTWTRDSAHAHGDAVDVIIDGAWDNAQGFARLQRIAREEGLRTLGVRDPGHLELPVDQQRSLLGAADTSLARQATTTATTRAATMAAQAGVARVAGVASVAGVARVGEGMRQIDRTTSTTTVADATAMNGASMSIGERGQSASSGFGRDTQDTADRSGRESSTLGSARNEGFGASTPAAFGSLHVSPSGTPGAAASGAGVTAPAAGAAAAARAGDLQDLRGNAPAGSVSRMTLNIDAPNGGQDRITVDLRGNSVGTQISTDAANAERLRLRTADLQDALGRRGLESESVRISGTARNDTADSVRAAITDRDGLRLNAAQQSGSGDGAAMNQGQRERAATAREWDRPDTSRQSREERESARQGAGQRGQRDSYNGSAS